MKHNRHTVLMAFVLSILLVLGMMPGTVFAEDGGEATVITYLDPVVSRPECGGSGEDMPDEYLSIENEEGGLDEDDAIKSRECVWITEYKDGKYVPFTGNFVGEETYKVFISYEFSEGYVLPDDFDPDSIYWDGEIRNPEIVELSAGKFAFVAELEASHQIDWDNFDSQNPTCTEPGYEDYDCMGCGKHIHIDTPADPDYHVWGDLEVIEESTPLTEGLRARRCTSCGAEEQIVFPRTYSKVYEPETSWAQSATVAWKADSSVLKTAEAEKRPGTAFVRVDQDLKVFDRDGGLVSDSVESFVKAVAPTMIPAFCIEDHAAADALKGWLTETGFEDCFVVSTPANKELVKDVADLPHVRGMLDYTAVTSLSRKDITDMIKAVNGSHGKVVLLSSEAATRENVRLLQSLCTTVWVETDTDLKTILTHYTNGVNGVLVEDYEAALEALEFFDDDAPSLLRVPLVLAHRGDPSNYAENTIESAQGAFEEGADAIENDIFLSKDGEIFIRHDGSLGGLFGQESLLVENLTLEQLKSYTVKWEGENSVPVTNEVNMESPSYGKLFGGKLYGEEEKYGYRIPTLREYFERFKGEDVVHDVEIKSVNTDIIAAYIALVDEYDAWDQVFNITFSADILDYIYENYPELSVGDLGSGYSAPEDFPYSWYDGIIEGEGPEVALEVLMGTLDCHNATYNNGIVYEEMLRAGRHRGLTAWTWTYSIPETSELFAKDYLFGTNGLTVNEAWVASGYIETIFSQDETVKDLKDVPKPKAENKVHKTSTLNDAELVVVRDLNDDGTEKLAIWRYQADMDVDGESFGSYYLYSNPFTVTIEKDENEEPADEPEPEEPVDEPTVEPETVEYWCAAGDGNTWNKGSKDPLVFIFKRDPANDEAFSHFTGVLVDGRELASSSYNAVSGSVELELKPEYLETLKTGKYTLETTYDDGDNAAATFNVEFPNGVDPDTGDHSNFRMWIGIAVGAVVALCILLILWLRRSKE